MSLQGNDSYTKLLIHSDAADGNTDFTDSSGSGHTITANGDVHHETDQAKFGNSSVYFDGGGDSISIPDTDDFSFGTGDFTIDFRFRKTRNSIDEFFCGPSSSAGSNRSVEMSIASTNKLRVRLFYNSTQYVIIDSTSTFTDTNWHHAAAVRYGNTLYLYADGVQEGTVDVTGLTVYNSNEVFHIGRLGDYATMLFQGYIDEFRISKGIARWTAAFTPPTTPYSLPFDEDKKLKLTIAAADVGSALTDFPVLVNLGTSVGKNSFDASAVFDELTPVDVDDDFTGTNGDAPDTRLWEVVAGTPTIQGNALSIRRDSSIDDNTKTIFKISGDLDVQIDFSSFTSAGDAGAFGIEINEYTDNRGYVFIYNNGTNSYYNSAVYVAGILTNGTPAATTDTSGKLRIVRSGSTINLYYWHGSGWTLQQTTTITTNDVNIVIWISTWVTNPVCSCLADNFTVNSGTVVWDTPKQLAFEIGDTGNQCYCEIERYVQVYDEYTKLLIHSDNPDGSINIIDSSESGHSIAVNGDTHHETDQQKFGASSIYFDGTDDYLSIPDSADVSFGSNDFTIDFRIRKTRNSSIERLYGQSTSDAAERSVETTFQTDNTLVTNFFKASSGYVSAASTGIITDTDWHHIAVVRYGNTLTQYIDGMVDGTADVTGESAVNSTTIFSIGRLGLYVDNSAAVYIDEFRISKGIARWTANFTPPTAAYQKKRSAQLWIKVPSISASAATILNLYYDSTQPDNSPHVGEIGSTPGQNVWNSNFVFVSHQAQDPSGTAPQIKDSTSNAKHGTSYGSMTSGDLVDGLIGKAIDYDGSDDYTQHGTSSVLNGMTAMTLEVGCDLAAWIAYGGIVGKNQGAENYEGYVLDQGAVSGDYRFFVGHSGGGAATTVVINVASLVETYITCTINATQAVMWMGSTKGTPVSTGSNYSLDGDTANLTVAEQSFLTGYHQTGWIDEIRISNIVRSDDWIAATNLSNTDALITFSFLEGILDRPIPTFSNFPKPYNTNFLPNFTPSGLIRQNRKGFSKAF